MTTVPYQKPGVPEAHGLSVAECEATAWTVTPEGHHAGAAAINAVLAVALGTRLPLLLYATPGVERLQEGAYALVARNRRRLPGDIPYCRRYPDECSNDASPV
ncbi:MAG: DUF393 domain-containing protein [Rubrobacter sp.]|nr:DUF393 domain-containing protein [Rubrobacter sp.]